MSSTEPPFFTTGSSQPFPAQEAGFLEAWEAFARWAAGLRGAGEAILARDLRVERRYVSFVGWDSMDAIRGWKGHPEVKERMARVRRLIDTSSPTEVEVVARIGGGA